MLSSILFAIGLLCVSALVSAVVARSDRAATVVGTTGCLAACLVGLGASLECLFAGTSSMAEVPWSVPDGVLRVGLDALSAFFLVCIFLVSGLAALYGIGYLHGFTERRRLATAITFFNLLVAAMAGVVIARDGVGFLIAWELMSMSSFFLVTYESDREDVRRAGMTYLIASHVGLVFLFLLFGILSRHAGSLGFEAITAAAGSAPRAIASTCFLLALVGFGTKAGLWPLHLWLPDAHPAAPSHVSALMSGVMIKMGIYGLLRTLTLLGTASAWWGVVLLGVGTVSGIAGVIHALAEHDLKRVLAYSSVENIGVVTLGIGVGVVGRSHGHPAMAFLGYAGALLHVLNHGLFKGLLFQGAGSVLHATGTRSLDSLGGLGTQMPLTAFTFLVGSVAISGLPPLNGFVSEWLIYVGAFRASERLTDAPVALALVTVPALALIGGLAAACFVRAFGIAFLGEPRSAAVAAAHECTATMRAAMVAGAGLCFVIGFFPGAALTLVEHPAAFLAGSTASSLGMLGRMASVTQVALLVLFICGLLALLRVTMLREREVRISRTWACGYAAPTPRMQYTAASFAEPLLTPFAGLLHRKVDLQEPAGYFPPSARYEERIGDLAGERFLIPASQRILGLVSKLRVIQHGRVQLYLAYVFVTLIALLLWQLGGGLGR